MSLWTQLWRLPYFWHGSAEASSNYNADFEDEATSAFPWEGYCVAPRCFDHPERRSAPQEVEGGQPAHPPVKVYRLPLRHKVPGMDFRWAAGIKAYGITGASQCKLEWKVYKALALPHVLGLNDDAHWKWPFIPVSFLVGVKGSGRLPALHQLHRHSRDKLADLRSQARLAAKMKILSPIGGSLGLRPTLHFLPQRKLTVKRDFRVAAHTYMSLGLSLQDGDRRYHPKPSVTFQLGWRQENRVSVEPQDGYQQLRVGYRGSLELPWDTTAAVGAHVGVPVASMKSASMARKLKRNARIDYVKLTKLIGKREARTNPAPTWRYLEAQRQIGSRDEIVVVPGHFIDPEGDTGAPGERDFNKMVAEKVAHRLTGGGWRVLRPDRDAPHLMWEEYINWVSRQTLRGVPVLEIHGQGPEANMEGAVWGVIGDARVPLNKELAKEFAWYPSDWKELAVPRRGGVIVEGFNSDEVLSMAPERRELAADRLAWRVWQCIEAAGEKHRALRGFKSNTANGSQAEPAGVDTLSPIRNTATSQAASTDEHEGSRRTGITGAQTAESVTDRLTANGTGKAASRVAARTASRTSSTHVQAATR